MNLFAAFVWDPSPYLFSMKIPLIDRPLLWYGLLFALGFLVGYQLLVRQIRGYCNKHLLFLHPSFQKSETRFVESLTFFVIIGGLLGARLGDLLFYQDWHTLLQRPLLLISFWEGGLASHGGGIGILISLLIFSKRYQISLWRLLDLIVMPTAFAAICIRLGNFFNQEILGTPTSLPWGVLFLHPADGSSLVPRHPAQLYEAICYLFIFLFFLYRRSFLLPYLGKMSACFLLLVFTARFAIEFVKTEQSVYLHPSSFLTMGQYLSIPFILIGLFLFYRSNKKRSAPKLIATPMSK